MAFRGEARVQILNTNGINKTVANQISNYRGVTKTVIHKVNRKLDKKFYINRLSFTEEAKDIIGITAKITLGEKQDADVIHDEDISNVMSVIIEELEQNSTLSMRTKVL